MGDAFLIQNIKQAPEPTVITDGLILHLDAGNPTSYPGTGTTWFNLASSNYNGTLVNGTGFNSTNNGVLTFDGSNDGVFFGSDLGGNLTGDFTITTFFKIDSFKSGAVFSLIGYNNPSNPFVKWIAFPEFNAETLNSIVATLDDDINKEFIGNTAINTNQWYEATITYTGNVGKFYINNVFRGQEGAAQPHSAGNQFFIGSYHSNDNRFFDGMLGVVLVYNKALTDEERLANFDLIKTRFGI